MIIANNIEKSFRRLKVLRGVQIQAKPQTLTILTGANGSGKSTFLKILAGLFPPDFGEASIGEYSVVRQRLRAQQHLSFLPQNVNFHPATTPERILNFYAKLRGVNPAQGKELLAELGLADALKRPSAKLSGGMLQRLGIALALLPDAPVLILDEPGSGLDPEWRVWLREKITEQVKRNKTVLLTTHQPEEWKTADVSLNFCNGKIIQTDATKEEI